MTHFKRSTSKDVLNRNVEEIRGWVINEMNNIEAKIDNVIIEHFKPINPTQFKKIMLNSSIVNIGGKIKILGNIKKFDAKIISKIRDISAIRNAFAHIPILVHFKLEGKQSNDGDGEYKAVSITDKIEVMNSSGLLKTKTVKEELENFLILKEEIINYLTNSHNS